MARSIEVYTYLKLHTKMYIQVDLLIKGKSQVCVPQVFVNQNQKNFFFH